MEKTFKMMKSIILGKEDTKEEFELIKEYQKNQNPSILAYFYCNNYGMICNLANSFYLLSNEDKASFCLQEIDFCLMNFNFSNKFITYLIYDLKMRYISESNSLKYNKRVANLQTKIFDDSIMKNSYELSLQDVNILYDNYNLSEIERTQANLLNSGYTPLEIAQLLKQAISTIYMRTAKIKSKILKSYI